MRWLHFDLAFPWHDRKLTKSGGIVRYCCGTLGNDTLAQKLCLASESSSNESFVGHIAMGFFHQ